MSDLVTMQDVEAIAPSAAVPVGAAEAFTQALQEAVAAQEYTGAVPLLDDKSKLVGIPFLVMGASYLQGMTEAGYVNIRIMLPDGRELCFNDGGSALMPVIDAHAREVGMEVDGPNKGRLGRPMYCPRGLRKSDYTTDVNGHEISATTFWFG